MVVLYRPPPSYISSVMGRHEPETNKSQTSIDFSLPSPEKFDLQEPIAPTISETASTSHGTPLPMLVSTTSFLPVAKLRFISLLESTSLHGDNSTAGYELRHPKSCGAQIAPNRKPLCQHHISITLPGIFDQALQTNVRVDCRGSSSFSTLLWASILCLPCGQLV